MQARIIIEKHLATAKRVLRYPISTCDLNLFFSAENFSVLHGYFTYDWSNCANTLRYQLLVIAYSLVLWLPGNLGRKTSRSSAQRQSIDPLLLSACEVMQLRYLLQDLKFQLTCNNKFCEN